MDLAEMRAEVRARVQEDMLAADLQCSLFVAALSTYRHDTVLRPFPPMFVSENNNARPGNHHTEKDYKGLEQACEDLPSIQEVLKYGLDEVEEKLVRLLHWILFNRSFTVKSMPKTHFEEVCRLTGCTDSVAQPNYVFQLCYTDGAMRKFEELRAGRDVFYAFHGSRVENFHSITKMGLHSHMNKNALFGEGTYLSSELSVSMPYSPTGTAWQKSMLGDKLGCIAVCEIIDDPSVKCQVKDKENGKSSRAKAPESMGGEVPEKYYIVRNNEVIQVKNLIVYADRSKYKQLKDQSPSWMYNHRFTLMIALYGLLLVFIGLYNSKTFHYFIKRNLVFLKPI